MAEQSSTIPSQAQAAAAGWATQEGSMSRRMSNTLLRFMRSSPLGAVSAAFWIILILAAIFANQIAPYDPLEANYAAIRMPPTAENLLGTDDLGRDILSRIIFGARITLIVAMTAVLIGDSIGFIWAIGSGYIGGRLDIFSQRLIEVLMSFPALILALLLLVALGSGLTTVIIAIAITRIPATTRITRSVVLSVKEMLYIEAAQMIGASRLRIMARHVAPQCLAPILVLSSLHLGIAIFAEAALSFLGLGIPPPAPSWGNMLGGVLAAAFKPSWWLVVFPGIAITLAILAANLLGDALRDFLDPKLKKRIE
jgi:ABC-type dipeptide/oligopeptide/nickel transport system permease subunit